MIAYTIYKLVHLLGIFMVFLAFGAMIHHVVNQGKRETTVWRKQVAITHGVGVFLILLGGFGMLARLGIHWPFPGWVFAKVVIWAVFGGLIAVVYRKPGAARSLWLLLLALGVAATYLALMKPF